MSNANDKSLKEFFGEPISVYTDAEGLEDGTLVDLGEFPRVVFQGLPINRMTSHLFDGLKPFLEPADENDAESFGRALSSTLRTKCAFRRRRSRKLGRGRGYLQTPAESLAGQERGQRLDRHVPGGLLGAKKRAGENTRSLSFCSELRALLSRFLCLLSFQLRPARPLRGGYSPASCRGHSVPTLANPARRPPCTVAANVL